VIAEIDLMRSADVYFFVFYKACRIHYSVPQNRILLLQGGIILVIVYLELLVCDAQLGLASINSFFFQQGLYDS
jgi:hypothetical protein